MGKASRKKAERRRDHEDTTVRDHLLDSTQPSQRVTEMLSGRENLLVTITLLGPPDPAHGWHEPMNRSMGFIVESFDRGLRLIASCRHVFENCNAPGYRRIVATKRPAPTLITPLGDPIFDTDVECDVAFLIVRDPTDTTIQPFLITPDDPPHIDVKILYNAQNKCEPRGEYYVFNARQVVKELGQFVFCKYSNKLAEFVSRSSTTRHEELERQGWHRYRFFNMLSREGYSGSPVYDDDLRLYGINARGSSPEDGALGKTSDTMGCLPTSLLYAARQRTDGELRQRLTELGL